MKMRFKLIVLFTVYGAVLSCSHFTTKSIEKNSSYQEQQELPPAPVITQEPDKDIALILGPSSGGFRFCAHAGVLSELYRKGFKIKFIAGLEKSALPALLYADDPGVSQVEWQLFKLSREDLLNVPKLKLKHKAIENFPVRFACVSYSLNQRRTYILSKGLAQASLNLCYHQFGDNPKALSFAHPTALEPLIKMAQSYSNKILYIDLINQSEIDLTEEGYHYALWGETIQRLLTHYPNVEVISIPLKGDSWNFHLRQEWMREGSKATQQWLHHHNLNP